MTILIELQTKKTSNILGKNPLPILLFTYYALQIKFLSLLEKKPAKISCERKMIKWARKLAIKRKAKGKRRERDKIEVDSQKRGLKFKF